MEKTEFKIGNTIIELVLGDITEMDSEAIVNAANSSLYGGGGVDGAIHHKGGSKILEECKKIRALKYPGGLPTGEAVITTAGNLKSRFIIHTVGPIWHGGNHGESKLLAKAYNSSLKLALSKNLLSISFPSISTGTYKYPIRQASFVALKVIRNFADKKQKINRIVMVLFSKKTFDIYLNTAKRLFS
jgi:O-acetyl-ADP-ribose deacetylase (regulator of RNase III)